VPGSFEVPLTKVAWAFHRDLAGRACFKKRLFAPFSKNQLRAMPKRLRLYRPLAFALSLMLLGPILPWTALQALQQHGRICSHLACPHKGQACTCHGHDGMLLWQRCHDETAALSANGLMPYGPLPSFVNLLLRLVFKTQRLLLNVLLPTFRRIADIFHPPRSH